MADAEKEGAVEAAAEVDTRGELRIQLDADYGLRPDFEAIKAIESKVGPLRVLYESAQAMELPIEKMAACVAELMKGYARAHPDDELIDSYRGAKPSRIAELIYEQGVPKVSLRLQVIFSAAIMGGYTASGEAKTPAMARTPAGD